MPLLSRPCSVWHWEKNIVSLVHIPLPHLFCRESPFWYSCCLSQCESRSCLFPGEPQGSDVLVSLPLLQLRLPAVLVASCRQVCLFTSRFSILLMAVCWVERFPGGGGPLPRNCSLLIQPGGDAAGVFLRHCDPSLEPAGLSGKIQAPEAAISWTFSLFVC